MLSSRSERSPQKALPSRAWSGVQTRGCPPAKPGTRAQRDQPQCWRPCCPPHLPALPAASQRPGWRPAPVPRGRGCPPALASPGSAGRQVAGLLEGRGMPASCCSPGAAPASLSSQPQLGRLPGRRPRGSRRRGGPGNTHCLTFCASGRARSPCKAQGGGQRRVGGCGQAGCPATHGRHLPETRTTSGKTQGRQDSRWLAEGRLNRSFPIKLSRPSRLSKQGSPRL